MHTSNITHSSHPRTLGRRDKFEPRSSHKGYGWHFHAGLFYEEILGGTEKNHYLYYIKLKTMGNSNLEIVKRLAELSKNELEFGVYPKPVKKEHIWLSNWLNDALKLARMEFSHTLGKCVASFKSKGWFDSPEKLIWEFHACEQIEYAIYGGNPKEITFNKALKKAAYEDLLKQIDHTVLMSPEELKLHNEKCKRIAIEILDEIEKDESK